MAEAMCGPSNPLQQFRKQGNIDRTLQQDRLTARHHPAQGFRSHDPNARLLDPEFEAFQAGLEPPILNHAQHFQAPQGFAGPSQAPSWATDFQQMHISPQPMQQQPQFQPGPSASNWAQDFSAHLAQTAPKAHHSSQSPLEFQQRARGFGSFGFQSQFAQPSYAPAVQSKGKEPVMADQFDESAFERAFDQARADMMADVEDTTQEDIQVDDVQDLVEKVEAAAAQEATQMLNESNQDLEDLHSMSRMHGADVEYDAQDEIQEEEQADQRQQQEDDALAATAQELLGKVEHNQSDKFKNSQFLGLMRKLADREVRVEGDKMVETANATSTSVADDTLNASSMSNAQGVYHGNTRHAPLAAATVDSRPPDYGVGIPPQEQDHDLGRINPTDGKDVVDILNQPGAITDDIESPAIRYKPWPNAHTYRTAAGCFFWDDLAESELG